MRHSLPAIAKRFIEPCLGHQIRTSTTYSTQAYITTSQSNSGDAGFSASKDHGLVAKTTSLIDRVVPRNRFGNSIFSTPLLLFLRLFYQATSFDTSDLPSISPAHAVSTRKLYGTALPELDRTLSADSSGSTAIFNKDLIIDIASKASTDIWPSLLQSTHYPISPNSTLQSMTWVKSLSAPLSHEYIQFVIESSDSMRRYRLVAERDTDGDWAYFIASANHSGSSQNLNKITQLRLYDYQHDLPLPLLSVSWNGVEKDRRPRIARLATILEQTSQSSPEYNVMREHCWWYAESVFEQMLVPSSDSSHSAMQPELRHWPWGAYRYSYIVCGKRVLRRDHLIEQAKGFREEMDRGGQLHW